jgi:hypothetical protein
MDPQPSLRGAKRRSNPETLGGAWIASSPFGRLAMTLMASPATGRRDSNVIARSEATKQSNDPGDRWIASSPFGRLAMTLMTSPACGRRQREAPDEDKPRPMIPQKRAMP